MGYCVLLCIDHELVACFTLHSVLRTVVLPTFYSNCLVRDSNDRLLYNY